MIAFPFKCYIFECCYNFCSLFVEFDIVSLKWLTFNIKGIIQIKLLYITKVIILKN